MRVPEDSKLNASQSSQSVITIAGLSHEEKEFLLSLARVAVAGAALGQACPEPSATQFPPRLLEKGACFVTLRKHEALRGCVGTLIAEHPLYRAVINNARGAALRDYRFPPLEGGELDDVEIEISVLTRPEPLEGSPSEILSKLVPHVHGVVLRAGFRLATFLPQVWKQIPDPTVFLEHLAQKAGCAPQTWRSEEASISIYYVEAFESGVETERAAEARKVPPQLRPPKL